MAHSFSDARKRQIAKLAGAKPPTARAAIALAKSQAYQDAADAPATLRAYAADLVNLTAWCDKYGFSPMPATPEVVGAYLAAAGEGYAMPTLRRRVAAIARACGVAGQPLDTKRPAIRETLRGIGRKHGSPARRSAALTTAEIKKLCRVCGEDLAGLRDRALFLLGFAGARPLLQPRRVLGGVKASTPAARSLLDPACAPGGPKRRSAPRNGPSVSPRNDPKKGPSDPPRSVRDRTRRPSNSVIRKPR
jgi:hypothetical protein